MTKFAFILLAGFVSAPAHSMPSNLVCFMEKNGWVHRMSVNFTSATEANWVVEVGHNDGQWSRTCWSRGPSQLQYENELYGDYECPAVRWSASLIYFPNDKALRFHKRDSDPRYDDIYACEQ